MYNLSYPIKTLVINLSASAVATSGAAFLMGPGDDEQMMCMLVREEAMLLQMAYVLTGTVGMYFLFPVISIAIFIRAIRKKLRYVKLMPKYCQ